MEAGDLTVGGVRSRGRMFFTGQPIWELGGERTLVHPLGYNRVVDRRTGALR